MDDPLTVRVSERVSYLACEANRGVDRQLALPRHPNSKRLAADVGHQVVEEGLYMTRVVEREDVGMLEAREKSDLADESKLTGF